MPRAAQVPDDAGWLDEMVTKLKDELNAQIDRVRNARHVGDDAKARAADARTLSELERTLERLARLERERAAARETKIAKHDPNARAALERRLDKLLEPAKPRKAAAKPQR